MPKVYETRDGKGGWTGTFKQGRPNYIAWRFGGMVKWIPVKKFLGLFWIRDRSKSAFFDFPNMFRTKES